MPAADRNGRAITRIRSAMLLVGSSVVLLMLVVQGRALPAAAQARAVSWNRYDAELNVQADGSLQVTETQAIQFAGTFQQGFRVIPTDRVTAIQNVSVSENVAGREVAYRSSQVPAANAFRTSTTQQGLEVDWWFPPTTNAPRTFVLRYTALGAIRVYPTDDQLEWKAVYADRDGPIAASTVTVRFPADIASSDLKTSFSRYTPDQASRLGALPSDGSGQEVDPRTISFAPGALPASTGAEVRVQFPHGLVAATPPAWQADADRADWIQQTLAPIGDFLALLLGIVILGAGGVGLFLLWYTRGRDPSAGAAPARLDRPPSDLPAPLAGTLVDEVADVQDAVATMVDLAQRGLLVIADETNPKLAGSSHDVRVTLPTSAQAHELRAYEHLLLVGLFGTGAHAGDEVLLSEIGGRFAAVIPALQEALDHGVAEAGLFVQDPQAVRKRYRGMGWVLVAAGLALGILAALALGWAIGIAWLPGLALTVVGFVLTRLASAMPRRTPAGALEAARWRAFANHLAHPDSPQSGSRAEDLPYAVAFGIDRSFLQRLESVGRPAPAWYPGGAGWGMPGGVIVVPGGFGGGYGPMRGPSRGPAGFPPTGEPSLPGMPNPQGWSDSLADLLNGASEALGGGGGMGGWSGGGFGGGGGGGGGSGGFR